MTARLPIFPLDSERLPDGQADWVRELIASLNAVLETVSDEERRLYRQIWQHLARYNSPVPVRQFPGINRHLFVVQQMIASLKDRSLLWFDDDLRAILQCPPFSVLTTAHQVKVFGWERAYTTSFVDTPLTLLIYGPNVWLEAQSICPRSGEVLGYRVMLRDDRTLRYEVPSAAQSWCIWLPADSSNGEAYSAFHQTRSKINAFNSHEDLTTHLHYQGEAQGSIYHFEQALYLSQCLLQSCWPLIQGE
jgi:hypothetical protein